MACVFCQIVSGAAPAQVVFEDEFSLAFLDHRPLFLGHTMLIPKTHYETFLDLPPAQVGPFFLNVQRLTGAVETAMSAPGAFVATNVKVSQSVPHLHVHIVPRRKGDGLRGFFWPRTKYQDAAEMEAVAKQIRTALDLAANR